MKKSIFTFFLIIFAGLFLFSNFALGQEEKVKINFFYSDYCPYCARENKFLDTIEEKYSDVVIKRHSVTSDKNAPQLLKSFYEKYKVPERNWGLVPALFVKDKHFIGFSEETKNQIIDCLDGCTGEENIYNIDFPFLGTVDTSEMSLVALTVLLGLLDGFNPCAMWILLFLIALLINTRSRKRMLLIGGAFLCASAIVYYLILNAWLSLFLAVSYVGIVRKIIGAIAIGVGIWQINNFINYQPGVCKVTGGEGDVQAKIRGKIKDKAKEVATSSINLGVFLGVIALAFAVNMVEFFCSAGVPAIFTQILSLNTSSEIEYQFYILLYTFIFMLDDLVIFLVAFFTLKQFGFTEKYNHWATLIGGILILVLGLLLVFRPEMLSFG